MTEAGPPRSHIHLSVAARTHVGVERGNNEDNVLVADLHGKARSVGSFNGELDSDNGGALLAVCDGMGGEAGGEIASSTAVEALFEKGVEGLPGRTARRAGRR